MLTAVNVMVFPYDTCYGKQVFQTARNKTYLIYSLTVVKIQLAFFKPDECKTSENATAIKNNCFRMFMVINA